MTSPWTPPEVPEPTGPWERPPEPERTRLLDEYEAAIGVRPERVGVRDLRMSDGTTWREWGYR